MAKSNSKGGIDLFVVQTEEIMALNLLAGRIGLLLGVVSGAVMGLFFHRADWMGGYTSYRRRLTRLGHISFFGLGFVNLFFALTLSMHEMPAFWAQVSSLCLIVGAATMPLCCFLSAWRKPLRVLFPIPVLSISLGIMALLINWNAISP